MSGPHAYTSAEAAAIGLCVWCTTRKATEQCSRHPIVERICRRCHAALRIAYPCKCLSLEEALRIHKERMDKDNHMNDIDTMHDELKSDADEAPANGHGRLKSKKAEDAPVAAMAAYQAAEDARSNALGLLEAQREGLLYRLSEIDAVLAKAGKGMTYAEVKAAHAKPVRPRASKLESEGRADSLPSRILTFLAKHPKSSAANIAAHVGMETPRVSAALNALKKRGLVSSSGGRRDMRWSAR